MGVLADLAWPERITVLWYLINGLTHLSMESLYLWLATGVTAVKAEGFHAFIWQEYAKADARWGVRDPNLIALELFVVFVMGPCCLWLAWATAKRHSYRHVLQVGLTATELFGGWMTFVPEWVEGSPNLDTSNWIYTWVYLFFCNVVWVVIPLVLMWDSVAQITHACAAVEVCSSDFDIQPEKGSVWAAVFGGLEGICAGHGEDATSKKPKRKTRTRRSRSIKKKKSGKTRSKSTGKAQEAGSVVPRPGFGWFGLVFVTLVVYVFVVTGVLMFA